MAVFERPGSTVCPMAPVARITTGDGAQMQFQGRGYATRTSPSDPAWRVAATLYFTTGDSRYSWLHGVLAMWEGKFNEATHHARYAACLQPAAPAVQAANGANLDQLTGLFKAGIAAGQWPADTDPALQARLFMAGVYGLMSQWHLAPGSFPLEAAMGALASTDAAGHGKHRGNAEKKGDGT